MKKYLQICLITVAFSIIDINVVLSQAQISAGPDIYICPGESAVLQGSAPGGLCYTWRRVSDNALISKDLNPEVSPTVTEEFKFIVTDDQLTVIGIDYMKVTITFIKLINVSYFFNHTLRSDDDLRDYDGTHWLDNNGNGYIETGDNSFPVCYTRNSYMNISAEFTNCSSVPMGTTVKIRGSGTVYNFPEIDCVVGVGPIIYPANYCLEPLPTTIDLIDPLIINWEVSYNNGADWSNAGKSLNTIYVLLKDPIILKSKNYLDSYFGEEDNLYETVVYIYTLSAKGLINEDDAIQAIFNEFADKQVKNRGGVLMKYWGPTASKDCKDVPQDVRGLLANANGSCRSWALLFRNIVGRIAPVNYTAILPPAGAHFFLIKHWNFGWHITSGADGKCNSFVMGDDKTLVNPGFNIGPNIPCITPGSNGILQATANNALIPFFAMDDLEIQGIMPFYIPACLPYKYCSFKFMWGGYDKDNNVSAQCGTIRGDAAPQNRIPAQCNNNSPQWFGNHFVVKYTDIAGNLIIYDPSYGTQCNDENVYENSAVDGYGRKMFNGMVPYFALMENNVFLPELIFNP